MLQEEGNDREAEQLITLDLLSEGITNHPLYADIVAEAAEHDLDLTNVGSVTTVLQKVSNTEDICLRSILLLSLILESLVSHNERLEIQALIKSGTGPGSETQNTV